MTKCVRSFSPSGPTYLTRLLVPVLDWIRYIHMVPPSLPDWYRDWSKSGRGMARYYAVSIFSYIHNSASGNCDSPVWLNSTNNENIVLGSARFYIEYKQMEHRVRLDVPTLADPQVRDLLQESDLFARSFSGGGFGFISPLDFINVFSLLVEILSHLWILVSFTRDASQLGILLLTIASALFPFVLARFSNPTGYIDCPPTSKEARAADKQERMRNLAYSDVHRPEIALFGLGDWILSSWSAARKVVLSSEAPVTRNTSAHFADIMYALQNVS